MTGASKVAPEWRNCTSSPSTPESVGNGFARHGTAHLRASEASIAFLFVASQLWRECVRQRQIRPTLTHHISQASFPRSITLPQLPSPCTSLRRKHLAYCLLIESRFRTGDLHPTSSRPCWAYALERSRGSWRFGNCKSLAAACFRPADTGPHSVRADSLHGDKLAWRQQSLEFRKHAHGRISTWDAADRAASQSG